MAEQVNVPGVGKTNRNWVLAGLAAVAGIVAYAYMRRARDTGPAPGSDEQLDQAGYIPSDWSPDAYVGATRPGGETYDPTIADTAPLTNADWSQRVVDLLEGAGFDRTKSAATVGKYLAGQPLDASEKLIIQTAIALLGNPPAGALPIISGTSTPTTTPPSTATKLAKPALRYSAGDPRNTNYALAWSHVPGAAWYSLQRSAGPGSPTSIGVIGTSRRTPALQRGATYSYRVRAIAVPGTGKTSSDWSNTVRFTVPRK
jgi:hypothetical protein